MKKIILINHENGVFFVSKIIEHKNKIECFVTTDSMEALQFESNDLLQKWGMIQEDWIKDECTLHIFNVK